MIALLDGISLHFAGAGRDLDEAEHDARANGCVDMSRLFVYAVADASVADELRDNGYTNRLGLDADGVIHWRQ